MKKLIFVFLNFMIFLGLTFACSKKDLAVNQDLTAINTPDLLGKWICKNWIFGGDAYGQPCYPNAATRELTVEFSKEISTVGDGKGFVISGQSSVNLFYASYKIISFDEKKGSGKIQISNLSGTKIAGTPEMNDCEKRYYEMMQLSTVFTITKDSSGKISMLTLAREMGQNNINTMNPSNLEPMMVFEK
jgi:hypothetical protein